MLSVLLIAIILIALPFQLAYWLNKWFFRRAVDECARAYNEAIKGL